MSDSNVTAHSLIASGRAWEAAIWAQRLVNAGAFDAAELRELVRLFTSEVLSPTPRKSGGAGRFDPDKISTVCRELDIVEFVKQRRKEGASLEVAFADAESSFPKSEGTAKRLYNKWKDFV